MQLKWSLLRQLANPFLHLTSKIQALEDETCSLFHNTGKVKGCYGTQ